MSAGDLGSFVNLVQQAQSADEAVRTPAYTALNNFMNSAPFDFFRALVAVLQLPENIPIKRVCIVYASNFLRNVHSPNPTQTTEAYLREQAGDVITTLMSLCMKFFLEFPQDAASLFAQLAKILLEGNAPVIQSFVEQMSSCQDARFLTYAMVALEYVVEECYLSPEQYQPLLKQCYGLLSGEFPVELKDHALKVIQNMIPDIDAIFESADNCKSILDMLAYAVQQDGLKVTALRCYAEIASRYFSVFARVAEATMPIVFTDLSKDDVDPEIVKAGAYLLQEVAIAERENESQAISKVIFGPAFPILTKLYVRHMDDEPWSGGFYDEHTQCCDALVELMWSAGEVSFEPVMQFVKENANHQAPQVRELTAILLAQVCAVFRQQLNGILDAVVGFCEAKLRDPQIRVRETALSVVHGLLDAEEISEPTQQAALKLIPGVLERLSDGPVVGAYVCEIVGILAQHNMVNTLQPLFNQLLGMLGQDDQVFIAALTNALIMILDHLKDYQGFYKSLDTIFQVTQNSFTDPALKRNQAYVIDVFCAACRKYQPSPKENLLAPVVGPLFQLFTQEFRESGTTEGTMLLAIASLGCSAGDAFVPHLEATMTIALHLLQVQDVGAISYRDATSSIITLRKYFDLGPYLGGLCRAAVTTAQNMESNFNALVSLLFFMNGIFVGEHTEALEFVIPIVHMIREQISQIADLVDRKQAWTFSIECLRFLSTIYKEDQAAFQQWMEMEYMLVFKIIQLNKWKAPIMQELVQFIALLADSNPEALCAFMSQNACIAEFLSTASEDGCADTVNKIEKALQR